MDALVVAIVDVLDDDLDLRVRGVGLFRSATLVFLFSVDPRFPFV